MELKYDLCKLRIAPVIVSTAWLMFAQSTSSPEAEDRLQSVRSHLILSLSLCVYLSFVYLCLYIYTN